MKVLLLGGTGVISTEVLNLSLQKGYEVTVFNRGNSNDGLSPEVNIIIGDYQQMTCDTELFQEMYYDVVVDFLSRKPDDIRRLYNIFKDKCNQYIFISTACVYLRNSNNQEVLLTESMLKPNDTWSYSVEKHKCEEVLKFEALKYGKSYTIVRPYITYGKTRIPFGLAPAAGLHWTIIARIFAGKPMFVWDSGEALSTFTHSIDFAKGIVGLFNNPKAMNEDFHITSNECYSWNEMLEQLYDLLDCKSNIVNIPSEKIVKSIPDYKGILLGDRKYNACFDNSKIKEAVPELYFDISLKIGLNESIQYYKSLDEKRIDYEYDSKIDRLISKHTKKQLKYFDYLNQKSRVNYIKYHIHRYLHPKIAYYTFTLMIKLKIFNLLGYGK